MSPRTREPETAHARRLDRLERLYEEARRLPEGERSAFLEEHCADDLALGAELESLLADATEAEAVMEALVGWEISLRAQVRSSSARTVPVTTYEGVPAGGAWGPGYLIVFAADSALWRTTTEGGARDSVPLPAPIDKGWPSFLPPGAGGSATPWVLVTLSGELHAFSVTGEDARPLGISGRGPPDGGRVLVDRRGEGLFVLDLENGRELLLNRSYAGAWSPRGDEVLTPGGGGITRYSVAPGSQGVPISDERLAMVPAHWGEDGVVLLFTADPRRERRSGLYTMAADGCAPVRELLDTDADEGDVVRSPDGRWIAYASDLSGRHEVYIRGFPVGEPRQVSIAGGHKPLFSRDGGELYYLSGEQTYAVALDGLEEGATLQPEPLFRGSYVVMGPAWDVRPQGDFLMVSAGPNWLREIRVLQNWNREIEDLFNRERLP